MRGTKAKEEREFRAGKREKRSDRHKDIQGAEKNRGRGGCLDAGSVRHVMCDSGSLLFLSFFFPPQYKVSM